MTREEALQAWICMRSEIDNENWLFVGTINPQMVDMAIEALSAEAYRPSGMWINAQGNQLKIGGYSGYCSVCHEWSEYLTDYCGNCGAHMVKENK